MKPRPTFLKLVFVAPLAVTAPRLCAQDGVEGALWRANLTAPWGRSFAVADFDNDKKTDGAVLVESGRRRAQSNFRVELHFTARENTEITFESTETALTVRARDIDNDNDSDVIVEESLTQQRLHVWLNDGQGGFHRARIEDFPSAPGPAYEPLNPPPLPLPALSFPPPRGPDNAMLAPRHVPDGPSSTREFEGSSVSSPASRPFTHNSSRAPPHSHSCSH